MLSDKPPSIVEIRDQLSSVENTAARLEDGFLRYLLIMAILHVEDLAGIRALDEHAFETRDPGILELAAKLKGG